MNAAGYIQVAAMLLIESTHLGLQRKSASHHSANVIKPHH
jgi:hypothetical protein